MKLKNSFTGFTVVEVLVVMAMTTVLAVAGTVSYNGAVKRDQVESYAKEVMSSLEKARNKAVNQEGGDSWGVRFEANSNSALSNYAIFKGEAAGTDFVDIKHLSTSVNFTAPNPAGAAPIEEIVFNKKTGTIKDGNNHSIQVGINNSSFSKNIYITKNGLATFELPPGIELLSAPVLSSPSDGLVIGSATSQNVEWGSVTGAQTYRLEVSSNISFSSLFFYDDTITSTSYNVINLQPYNVYYWRVRAHSASAGNSSWSDIRSFGTLTAPDAPQSPSATPSSATNTLTWNVPATNGGSAITGYKIYWGTVSGTLSNTISPGNVLTYNHTGLSNGTTYYYKIAAINVISEGTKTSEFSSTPVSISLPTAGTLTLTPSTASYIPGTVTTMSAPFTSNVAMTGCEYTLNGGTNWYASTLSGSSPDYTCTQSNITGFADGSSYTLNMRGTNSAGTTAATAATRTGDTTGPTVTDSWTNNWTATSPVSVTLTPTDARSGVATTKYCVDTANTCSPSSGSTGTSVSVTCSAGTTCTQYVRYAAWDNVGNASSVYSETVRQDSQTPTNPTLTATPGSAQIALSWTASSDTGAGLHATTPYKLVYATGATAPADCSGTALYSGTATSYTHTSLANEHQYSYRICALDALSNTSTGTTASAIAGNTLPTAGSLTLTPSTASYIPGTVTTMSAPFTSNVAMTGCEYTLNGGTNWYASTLSGSSPDYTCTQSNITGFADGSSYTLNMRGTNSAGTTAATAATRTGDTTGPTVTDSWTDNWTSSTSAAITLTPSDARSGVATTKYCVDTANTCSPTTVGTSFSVTCSAGTTCTQYVRYAAWDNVGNAGSVSSKRVRQDSQAPTDGTLTATPGEYQNSLSWSGFSDSGSGLASANTYKVVFLTTGSPNTTCSNGTQVYLGTGTSTTHTSLTGGTTYYYRVCAYDAVGNISNGATGNGVPTTTTTTSTTQPAASLVSYWKLDEGSSTTAADSQGTNTGTLINSPTWDTGYNCISGRCLNFLSTSGYVDVPDSPSLDITSAITIEAWVKTNSNTAGEEHTLVSKVATGQKSYSFYQSGTQLRLDISSDGTTVQSVNTDNGFFSSGTWVHAVVTYNGTTWKAYKNGAAFTTYNTISGSIYSGTAPLRIGPNDATSTKPAIDEVRIYNYALTAGEVSTRYSDSAPNIVGLWKFDETSGTTAADSSGKGNTANLEAQAAWTTSGRIDGGISLDGVDDRVTVPYDSSLDLSNRNWTISFWAYPTSAGTYDQYFLDNVENSLPGTESFYIGKGGGNTQVLVFLYNDSGTQIGANTDNVLTLNNWNFVTVTFVSGVVHVYVNGVEKTVYASTFTGYMPVVPYPIHIGGRGTHYFPGTLDDVRIYNYALSASDILALYNSAPSNVPGAPGSLTATANATGITLNWNAASGSGITNYKIYRGGTSGGETLLTTVGNVLTYNDAKTPHNILYYYKVTAVNGDGEGTYSNEAAATTPNFKYIFASATATNGNLGGYSGANTKCSNYALNAGLPGGYVAWISDASTMTAAVNISTHAQVPYKKVDGTVVANNWADLIDGTLQSPINMSETGGSPGSTTVWTNTTTQGTRRSTGSYSCSTAWSRSTSSYSGYPGLNTSATSTWTSNTVAKCNVTASLYCVEN